MVDELRRRIHESRDANALNHPVEIASSGDAQVSEQVQGTQARRLPPFVDAEVPAHLADESTFAIPLAQLARQEDEIPGSNERHVVRARRARRGKLDPLISNARFDDTGHRSSVSRRHSIATRVWAPA